MKKCIIVSLFIITLAGCGNEQPKQVTEVRTVAPMPEQSAPTNTAGAMGQMGVPAVDATANPFQWELPAGWAELEPTSLRIANFKVDADPSIECYVTILSGAAGGVEANVNRWCRQMGQPAFSSEQIEALPTITIMNQASPYVEIKGDFTSMDGAAQSDYMMLAAIGPLNENTIFVKMTGPADAVQSEKERFQALCMSLKKGDAPTDGAAKEGE